MEVKKSRYKSNIVAASLLINESRKIAELMLQGLSEEEWKRVLYTDNILQRRSPLTIRKQSRVLRNRLELMTKDFHHLIAEANQQLLKQSLLVTAVKHSYLLGDFIHQVVIENHKQFKRTISDTDWSRFFSNCSNIDPSVDQWADSTVKKIRQIIFKILAEADYINNTREKIITPVIIEPELLKYLKRHKETYILKSIQFHQ